MSGRDLLDWIGLAAAVMLIVLGPWMVLRPERFGTRRATPSTRRLLGLGITLIALGTLVRDLHLIRF